MFDNAQPLIDEFHDLETQLADPALHADLARSRKVGRRYAALRPVVEGIEEYRRLTGDREAAAELAAEDASFAEEVGEIDWCAWQSAMDGLFPKGVRAYWRNVAFDDLSDGLIVFGQRGFQRIQPLD